MLTGLGNELDKKLAKQMGADGYITKPFSLRDLKKTIGRLLKSPR
jgi:DNA-binding response OmpR family regulator